MRKAKETTMTNVTNSDVTTSQSEADLLSAIRQNEGVEQVEVRERSDEESVSISTKGKRAKRVVLNIIDGKVDLSRTPDPQVKQLAEALAATPESLSKLSLSKGEAVSIPVELCSMTIQLANQLERLLCVTAFKVPQDIATQALTLTKAQHDLLLKPTQKVLSKYVPSEWMAYSPETELVMAIIMVGQDQLAAVKLLVDERNQKAAQQTTQEVRVRPNGSGKVATPSTGTV